MRFFRFALLGLVLLLVSLISALTAMRLAIHGREVAMPLLVGKTPAEAQRLAQATGLQLQIERQYYSPTIPEGRIMSQVPDAGLLVRRGWQVRAAESLGPQRVQIPDVTGQSRRAAEFNIRRRGLDVGAVAQIELEGSADQVLGQNPPANAGNVSAPKINLLVAKPTPPAAYVMPNFVGQPLAGILPSLQDAGLHVGVVTLAGQPLITTTQAASSSTIVAQNPPAGQKVVAGSAVNFEVR